MKSIALFFGLVLLSASVFAREHDHDSGGPADAVILIVRHAEKPDSGQGLSPAGQERAQAYVNYFKNFALDKHPLKIDSIFAAADSKESHRPRLTLEPTAKALGLTVDSRFKDRDYQGLVNDLRSRFRGRTLLIAWHHGEIPALVRALGADSDEVIPGGKWPGDVFGWLIELRYDAKGQLLEARRIDEDLMPDDLHSKKP